MKSALGWHFVRASGRLSYKDGRKVEVGKKLSVKGQLIICCRGLHASRSPLKAFLNFRVTVGWKAARKGRLCRVLLEGEIYDSGDKLVARSRTVIAMLSSRKTWAILWPWESQPYRAKDSRRLHKAFLTVMGITAWTRKAKA